MIFFSDGRDGKKCEHRKTVVWIMWLFLDEDLQILLKTSHAGTYLICWHESFRWKQLAVATS